MCSIEDDFKRNVSLKSHWFNDSQGQILPQESICGEDWICASSALGGLSPVCLVSRVSTSCKRDKTKYLILDQQGSDDGWRDEVLCQKDKVMIIDKGWSSRSWAEWVFRGLGNDCSGKGNWMKYISIYVHMRQGMALHIANVTMSCVSEDKEV